jgi:hypothetical protein
MTKHFDCRVYDYPGSHRAASLPVRLRWDGPPVLGNEATVYCIQRPSVAEGDGWSSEVV